MRLIDADTIEWHEQLSPMGNGQYEYARVAYMDDIDVMPTIEPERKKDIIQKFHDYQIDWLKSHYDIELEQQLEEMIIRFLHDTTNRYIMEEGEQE